MIPSWFAAVDNAHAMLKEGGFLGVTDFYVSRKYARERMAQHGWFYRTGWPIFFSFDNVFLSRDHLPYLIHHFKTRVILENLGSVPYTLLQCPYYVFIGSKK